MEGFLRPEGDSRGTLKKVTIGREDSESTDIVIHTESDDYLEITVLYYYLSYHNYYFNFL